MLKLVFFGDQLLVIIWQSIYEKTVMRVVVVITHLMLEIC